MDCGKFSRFSKKIDYIKFNDKKKKEPHQKRPLLINDFVFRNLFKDYSISVGLNSMRSALPQRSSRRKKSRVSASNK